MHITVQFAVALVFVVVSALGVVWATLEFLAARNSSSWARTTGQIIEFSIEQLVGVDGDELDRPVVKYVYHVNDHEYVGHRIRFGGWASHLWRDSMADWARRYPVGKTVQVAYDPADPLESVLEPGRVVNAVVAGTLFIAVLVVGFAIILD